MLLFTETFHIVLFILLKFALGDRSDLKLNTTTCSQAQELCSLQPQELCAFFLVFANQRKTLQKIEKIRSNLFRT